MSQKLLTFSWHLWRVAIWEPYDCWQIGMSAQACTTWPHWALCLSVYNRNIDTILAAVFLCKDTSSFHSPNSPLLKWQHLVFEVAFPLGEKKKKRRQKTAESCSAWQNDVSFIVLLTVKSLVEFVVGLPGWLALSLWLKKHSSVEGRGGVVLGGNKNRDWC